MTKTQLLQYILAFIGLTGVVGVGLYYGTLDPKTNFPSPISVDGQVIEFTWTDDNSNEDLHIFTDKATYDQGVSGATVYVAVANTGSKPQNVELQPFFRDSTKEITDVSVLSRVTRNIYTPVMEENCVANPVKKATTTLCSQKQVSTTTTQEIVAQWVPLEIVARTTAEILKENTWSSKATFAEKQVENFIAEQKTKSFPVEAGEVIYYKVNIKFPANVDDNFYFVAKGSEGGYGHLDPWFNASWGYRVKIEVNPTYVAGSTDLVNYPVYVNLNNLPAGFHTNVKTDGCDIRVVESDETTETPFEVVWYTAASDTGELHFRADSLSYNATSTFYIYYGNAGASCYAVTDTYGRNNVWTQYDVVLHAQSALTDATGAHTVTQSGTVAYAAGKMGNGFNMPGDGTNYPIVADSAATDYTGNHLISWWGTNEATTGRRSPFTKGSPWTGASGFWMHLEAASTPDTWAINGPGASYVNIALPTHEFGTSLKYGVYRKVAATSMQTFFDATATTLCTSAVNARCDDNYTTNTSPTWVGRRGDAADAWDGIIDEFRMTDSVSVLTADWITSEYNNQNSPSTFYWIGAEEAYSPGGGGTTQRPSEFFMQ